jgi:thioesterase domain-containing protein/acyl carrier protein
VACLALSGDRPEAGELRSFLQEKLPAYMVPSAFLFPDPWPRTPGGKTDRRALAALDPNQDAVASAGILPRDEVELRLSRIWQEILGIPEPGITDDFFSLGGHSLLAVRLMAWIEQELGCRLPLAAIFEAPTVQDLASLVRRRRMGTMRREPLVKIQPRGTALPFFCVHPVGGNVFSYLELAHHLGAGQPFYGLQSPDPLPGSGGTPDSLEAMAACYNEAIREVRASGPYLLGGWSMGGVVAFEMARQLQQAGEDVALVALLDTPQPPDDGWPEDPDPAALIAGFAQDLTGQKPTPLLAELQRLDPGAQLLQVLRLAQSSGALPPGADLSQITELFAIFQRNARALRRYRPSPYPGRVDWFRTMATAAASPAEGWRRLANGGVAVHPLPGDHRSFLKAPCVESLAELLRQRLQPGSGTP